MGAVNEIESRSWYADQGKLVGAGRCRDLILKSSLVLGLHLLLVMSQGL